MRRRLLLGGGGEIEYVFSAQTSVSVSYKGSFTSVNIKSTANGSNIGYSVVSYDRTVVTSVTTAATSVTIRYSGNSTYESRSGNVVLKQNDSNKTITINVSQSAHPLELLYDGILLDGTSGSYGSIRVGTEVSFLSIPDWANVTYSDSKINVTALSENSANTARSHIIVVSTETQSTILHIIQLPSDYHSRDYVPIGGANWAIKNVGASSVQDYGNYYMYGKGSRTYTYGDSYYEGTENPLASSADTATQVLGNGWRMPTRSECQALIDNSYYYWVSYNGVYGGVYESSGNVLFIPAAGYRYRYDGRLIANGSECNVWSSTPYDSTFAYRLYFGSGKRTTTSYDYRNEGASVRGVQA